MLEITIDGYETFDEVNQEFSSHKAKKIELEHSLMAISKWESKWHKPFLSKDPKSSIEVTDYIKCMTITKGVPDSTYLALTKSQYQAIDNYISDPMTATVIKGEKKSGSSEILTSELLYYYMISNNIPLECQKWHLNKLLTLIRVFSVNNQPAKKKNQSEILRQNAALNAARKKELNTKG